MSVVTMRTSLSFDDAPAVNLYGFPVPYWRWSGVSSLEYVVDPVALAVDLLLHALVIAGLLRWARRARTSSASPWWWRLPLYIVATLVVSMQALVVVGARPMVDDAVQPVDVVRSLHVGLGRAY